MNMKDSEMLLTLRYA